uniref:Uncharacterized protein n=1 Tax=Moniliophthora roreri TaxID=221103 RepID=A0A0W0F9X3_MONRR
MSFQGASRFIIEGGSFTNIARDQHNYVQGNLVQYVNGEKGERTIWDEFTRIPLGKIRIKKTLTRTKARRTDFKDRSWRNVDAHRTVNIASIQGEDKDSEFLHITYSGPDASETFHRDFQQFSHVRDVTVAQLFGYNDGQFALPALIFYDALVPVAHIFERNGFSPLLYTYLDYLFGVMHTGTMDFGELWLHPRTGMLCTGPFVDYSGVQSFTASGFKTNSVTSDECPSLSLQTYSDSNTLISFLTHTLSTQDIIKGICCTYKLTWEKVSNKNAQSVLSCLSGTVYSRTHHRIIAQWPGDMEKWHYKPWGVRGLPDEMQESWVNMGDGLVRITVLPLNIQHLQDQEFGVGYDLVSSEEWWDSWLSQAHSILSQCGFQESDLEDCSIMDGLWLSLQYEDKHSTQTSSNASTDKPVYLFILPIPYPSDPETTWNSWLQGLKYFWSFDPSGNKKIPEDIRLSLGLPSFTSWLEFPHCWWDCITYNALHQLHVIKGFNPTTTAFAQSLGYPLLEVIGDEACFEEIEDTKAIDVVDELTILLSKLTINPVESIIDIDSD